MEYEIAFRDGMIIFIHRLIQFVIWLLYERKEMKEEKKKKTISSIFLTKLQTKKNEKKNKNAKFNGREKRNFL